MVDVMAELVRLGTNAPYRVQIWADLKDSSQYTVYLNQAGITMPNRDYYIELDNERFAKARDGLPVYIAKMLVRAGMDEAEASAAAAEVYALETAIAEAQWDAVANRDPQKIYNPYPLASLSELGDSLNWSASLEVLGLDGLEQVIVEQPSYFEALDGIIAETPLATWKHYLTFRLLDGAASYLDETTDGIRFDYRNRTLYGQEEQQPRWKRGITVVNGLVGEAVGKLYVAEHFPPEAKAKMEELVQNVIATLALSLDDLEWMTPQTRAKAREKLSKFTPKIGYPDVWKDYSALEIVAGDNLGNLTRAMAWNYQRDLDKLGKPVDKTEWGMTPQTVNAYYSPPKNQIVFPAAILQPPFFNMAADDAVNYGAIGAVIGHEIGHGFDDKGSTFDGDGVLRNWWTDEDRAEFEARTARLIDQYNGFRPFDDLSVNGEFTQGENIGDLGGITIGLLAYKMSLDGEEPPVIDGFTGVQRVFIGFAQIWRGIIRDAELRRRIATDPHSPKVYRTNGSVRNVPEWYDAFGVQEEDAMYLPPDERVKIW